MINLDWWFCDAAPNPPAEQCSADGIGSARGRIRFYGNGNGNAAEEEEQCSDVVKESVASLSVVGEDHLVVNDSSPWSECPLNGSGRNLPDEIQLQW